MLKPFFQNKAQSTLKMLSNKITKKKNKRNIKTLPRPDSPSLPLQSPPHMVGVQSLLRWSCSWGTQRTPSRSEPLQNRKYWFLFAIINAFVTYKKSLEGAKTSESYRHLIGLVILITSWKKRQDYFRANVTNMEWDDNYFCPIIFRSRQKLYFSVIVLEGNIWLLS